MPNESFTFPADGAFGARAAAERALRAAGFSIGPTDHKNISAIMFGDLAIAKWHSLTSREREACHATAHGSRDRPLTIIINAAAAPPEAIAAFASVRAAAVAEIRRLAAQPGVKAA